MGGPFRYLASPADADPVAAQYAIASRLSFMLVGSPPDRELRELAAAGNLRDPKVLEAQVDRLLADHRERFSVLSSLSHIEGRISGHPHPYNFLTGHNINITPGVMTNTVSID